MIKETNQTYFCKIPV